MAKRIVIDPVTRIEGHLRVDVEVDKGVVTKAWSSAQMFRGIETILKGRDPRDAWFFAQRFCGVCTTTHAIASVRAVEDALKLEVPLNAQYIRNMIIAAHAMQDNIVHFYHLSALDFVDIVSALQADPAKAAQIAQSKSDWSLNSVQEFTLAQKRLAAFVDSKKLGIFGTGYWGHPAMKLSPEINLIAFSHYLLALEYQRKASQAVAILGGKDPHIQNLCVGGVASAINMDNLTTINMERLAFVRSLMEDVQAFVDKVLIPDVLTIASVYPEWFNYGAGVKNYLSVPEFPIDTKNTKFMDRGGVIFNGDLSTFREIKDHHDVEIREKVSENVAHAWYVDRGAQHPWKGTTDPKYTESPTTGFADGAPYSWCKAPQYDNKPFQVGPLAQILAAYAAGDERTVKVVNKVLAAAKIKPAQLESTLGRHAARAIRCQLVGARFVENLELLLANIGSGDKTYANPVANIPNGRFEGVGFHEAPRGMLSHWVVINNGVIENYQAVVPSTWNAAPKDKDNNMGPYEASLIGVPVADESKPLEVIRVVHSFDPCIACAVHTVDPEGKEIVKVSVR